MNAPDGYTLGKPLHSSARSVVYAATRAADQRSVVLKTYVGSAAHRDVEREYRALRKAEGPGVPRALDLDRSVEPPVLVLDSLPGVSLLSDAGTIALTDFLTRAAKLAAVVARVHAVHLLHRDIAPENVRVCLETGDLWLIDFGLALEFGGTVPGTLQEELMSAGLALYMAPELSGRMARGSDFRSDLYSLGATLYHLWCGRPPFEAAELIELLHAHAAVSPPAPEGHRPDTPRAISRILQKLLEKEPDGRYQSANALLADLEECQRQAQERGAIEPDLELGTADAATRPLFSRKLYGREKELAELEASLERVIAGNREVWLVRGAPGVGKSALIEGLRAVVLARRGCMTQGKFDLYRRDLQYHGWIPAIAGLVDQLLAHSESSNDAFTSRLREALGVTVGALVELAPDLGLLLGRIDPVPPLPPVETRRRLAAALARLMEAVATPEHPVVLVLDDLQWADAGSRAVLVELLQSERASSLMIFGTYRDNEEEQRRSHADLARRLDTCDVIVNDIHLSPLSVDACTQMLGETLGRPAEDLSVLADSLARKTENNPFLVQQFVEHLRATGLLYYRPGEGWCWDDEQIATAAIPEEAVGLMVERIGRLEPGVREVLVFASFVGDQFDADLLRGLARHELGAIEAALFELSDVGMIVPGHAGFQFAHDRIREAAQSLRSAEERAQLHYDTANLLLGRLDAAERRRSAVSLADQFNRALALVEPEQRMTVAEINVWAAQRALGAGAYSSAEVYIEAARALLPDEARESQPELCFELDYMHARTRDLMGHHAEAESILKPLAERARTPDQLARVTSLRVEILACVERESGLSGPNAELANEIGAQALKHLGAPYPPNPSLVRAVFQLTRAYLAVRRLSVEDLLREAGAPDAPQAAMAEIESALSIVSGARVGRSLYAAAYGVRRFREGFAGPNLPLMLAMVGGGVASITAAVFPLQREAERLGALALELLDRGYRAANPYYTAAIVHYVHFAWTRHGRVCAAELERTIQIALEEGGDPRTAAVAAGMVSRLRFDSGAPVRVLEETSRRAGKLAEQAQDSGFQISFYYGARCAARLADAAPIDADEPLRDRSEAHWTEVHRGYFWFILSEFELSAEAYANIPETDGFPTREPFQRGLANAICSGRSRGAAKRNHRRVFLRDRRKLRVWARRAPQNFTHQVLLLDAEQHHLKGRTERALRIAQQAIRLALAANYAQDVAVSRERCVHYLAALNRHMEAAREIHRILRFSREWGAHAKVTHLQRQHADLLAILPWSG